MRILMIFKECSSQGSEQDEEQLKGTQLACGRERIILCINPLPGTIFLHRRCGRGKKPVGLCIGHPRLECPPRIWRPRFKRG